MVFGGVSRFESIGSVMATNFVIYEMRSAHQELLTLNPTINCPL